MNKTPSTAVAAPSKITGGSFSTNPNTNKKIHPTSSIDKNRNSSQSDCGRSPSSVISTNSRFNHKLRALGTQSVLLGGENSCFESASPIKRGERKAIQTAAKLVQTEVSGAVQVHFPNKSFFRPSADTSDTIYQHQLHALEEVIAAAEREDFFFIHKKEPSIHTIKTTCHQKIDSKSLRKNSIKSMPAITPHSSINDLLSASKSHGQNLSENGTAALDMNGAGTGTVPVVASSGIAASKLGMSTTIPTNASKTSNTLSRPAPIMHRRKTTGDVSPEKQMEYFASLQQSVSGPMTMPGMPVNTNMDRRHWPVVERTSPSPTRVANNYLNTNTVAPTPASAQIITSSSHHQRGLSGTLQMPQIHNLAVHGQVQSNRMPVQRSGMVRSVSGGYQHKSNSPTRGQYSPSRASPSQFLNPFEDPSIVGDLSQSISLTNSRSFSKEEHPSQPKALPVNALAGGLTIETEADEMEGKAQPQPKSKSPSHRHSQFDPLLNTEEQSQPSVADKILQNTIVSNNPTHKQTLTLDTASLADIAAQLSSLKPQKKEKDEKLESKINHSITLGTKPVESTGTKKTHRRFLSHQFTRSSKDFEGTGNDDEKDSKGSHRRSISAGISSVFKRDSDGDGMFVRPETPTGFLGKKDKKGSSKSPKRNADGSERPLTPGRRMLGIRQKFRMEKNSNSSGTEPPQLEVIASASGEDGPNVEIKLRTSEQDPSLHQISIPSASDFLFPAKLCKMFEEYRTIDQNFDFASLQGMTRGQMLTFVQKYQASSPAKSAGSPTNVSVSTSSPISAASSPTNLPVNRSLSQLDSSIRSSQQQLVETHVPIVSSLLESGNDLVLEGFYHELSAQTNNKSYDTASEKSTRCRTEVAIFKNDAQRQFVVMYQGCAEDQTKPVKKKEHKDGVDRRFTLGRKDDDNRFSEEQPVVVFPPFRRAYFKSDLEDKVFAKLDELAEQHPFFDVVMTGHSFGGVLALLAGMRYANAKPAIFVSCFAFGCPKIGTTDYRYYVHSLPNLRVMRVEYGSDPWINTPDHPTWCHAGHTISINTNNVGGDNPGPIEYTVKAIKFGDNRPESGGRDGNTGKVRKILSRPMNKEKQLDHDIMSYVHSLEEIISFKKGTDALWPKRFAGEEGTGVEGLNKEKRLVC